MEEMSRYTQTKGLSCSWRDEVTEQYVPRKKSCDSPWWTGSVKKGHRILQWVKRAAGCSCLDRQNKGALNTKITSATRTTTRRETVHAGVKHLETWPKGYSLSGPSRSVQECILHRSAHLLSVSAFLVQEGLCCSKHIALPPPPHPWGRADWGEGSMLRSNTHWCVDSAPGQGDEVEGRE